MRSAHDKFRRLLDVLCGMLFLYGLTVDGRRDPHDIGSTSPRSDFKRSWKNGFPSGTARDQLEKMQAQFESLELDPRFMGRARQQQKAKPQEPNHKRNRLVSPVSTYTLGSSLTQLRIHAGNANTNIIHRKEKKVFPDEDSFQKAVPSYTTVHTDSFCDGSWGVDRKKLTSLQATQSVVGCGTVVSADQECSATFYYGVNDGSQQCRCALVGKTCQVSTFAGFQVYELTQDESVGGWQDGRDIGKETEDKIIPAPKPAPEDESVGGWQNGRNIGKETEDKMIPASDDIKPAPEDESVGGWQDGRDIGKEAVPSYTTVHTDSFCSGSWGVDRKKLTSLQATQSVVGCATAVSADQECSATFYYGVNSGSQQCRCALVGKACLVSTFAGFQVYDLTQVGESSEVFQKSRATINDVRESVDEMSRSVGETKAVATNAFKDLGQVESSLHLFGAAVNDVNDEVRKLNRSTQEEVRDADVNSVDSFRTFDRDGVYGSDRYGHKWEPDAGRWKIFKGIVAKAKN